MEGGRKVLRVLLAMAVICLATACEDVRELTIKPDGSGRILERVAGPRDGYGSKINKDGVMQLGAELPSVNTALEHAKEFGEGVEIINYKKIDTEDQIGYEVIYSFADVTKLVPEKVLGFSPPLPDVPSDGTPIPAAAPWKFEFTKGAVCELRLPKMGGKSGGQSQAPTLPASADDLKQRDAVIEGIKHSVIRTTIRIDGTIESTNSHYRDGNVVTLLEMNGKGAAADPKNADYFKTYTGKPLPKEPPPDERYFKEETVDVLAIRFR